MTTENVTPSVGTQQTPKNVEMETYQGSDMESAEKGTSPESFDEYRVWLKISKFMAFAQKARRFNERVRGFSPVYDFIINAYRFIKSHIGGSRHSCVYASDVPYTLETIARAIDIPGKIAELVDFCTQWKADKQRKKIQSLAHIDAQEFRYYVWGLRDDLPITDKDGTPIEAAPYPGFFERLCMRLRALSQIGFKQVGSNVASIIGPILLTIIFTFIIIGMFIFEVQQSMQDYDAIDPGGDYSGVMGSLRMVNAVTLIRMGAFIPAVFSLPDELPRMFLSAVLHSDMLHMLGNLMLLIPACIVVESRFGKPALLASILLAIIGDTVAQFVESGITGNPYIIACGASGVLYGVVSAGVLAWLLKKKTPEEKSYDSPHFLFIIAFLTVPGIFIDGGGSLLGALMGAQSNVSLSGHLGGLFGGIIAALMMPMREHKFPVWVRLVIAAFCVAAVAGLFFCYQSAQIPSLDAPPLFSPLEDWYGFLEAYMDALSQYFA